MHAVSRYILKSLLKKAMREQVGRTPPFAMFQHDLIASRIIVDGFFERPYLEFLKTQVFPRLDSHEVCLDIGANIGNHSVFFADHFENVISFEPNPRTHDVLLANARLRPNIETYNIGLSDQAGEVEVSYDPRNIGMASIDHVTDAEFAVRTSFSVQRLDEVALGHADRSVDFIKIDVEGHEYNALLGAQDILERHSPVICMELLATDAVDGDFRALGLVQQMGYQHIYIAKGWRPFEQRSKVMQKLATVFIALFTGQRSDERYTLQEVSGLDVSQNYPMVICSKTALLPG